MKRFQLRKNCEYVIEIEAENEAAAWASVPDNAEWEHSWSATEIEEIETPTLNVVVGICREDNQRDVDETYGPGTYARLFPQS